MCGLHDELTPACSMRMHHALPNSRVKVFQNSSHTPFFEEPDEYFATLTEFLEANRAIKARHGERVDRPDYHVEKRVVRADAI